MLCLSHANIIDVAAGRTIAHRSVIIQDGRIDAILAAPPTNFTGAVRDAAGLFLCPGLIDCHVHFFLDGGPDPRGTYLEADNDRRMAWARHNARMALSAGITTMRDCGAPGPLMFEFQRQLKRGTMPGPNVISCGYPLMRPR